MMSSVKVENIKGSLRYKLVTVDEIVRTTPYEDLSKMYLNVKLVP